MFSGIIEKTVPVKQVEIAPDRMRLTLETGFKDIEIGESIAVNGVCLTVSEWDKTDGDVWFFVSHETLEKTNLPRLSPGTPVNIERALRIGARLSGHFVQGHVEGKAKILCITEESESIVLEIEIPQELARYCIAKGSICLDGVSLTINEIRGTKVKLNLVPHTWKVTRFSSMNEGDELNLETDLIARHLEKLHDDPFYN